MMDKKESSETKKYTALREGLTEVIAIPTYITCGYLAGKGGNLFKNPEQAKLATHNLWFLGVCTAALFVIPALCSIAVDPFSKRIFKEKSQNTNNLDIEHKSRINQNIVQSKIYQSNLYKNFSSFNMRVV